MTTLDLTADAIDVRDIIERLEELDARNQPQWVAGWNMPGYMPDMEPVTFDNADEALEYIKETILEVDPEQARHAGFKEFANSLKADDKGELGVNFGGYHYFITKDADGENYLDVFEREELKQLIELMDELKSVGGGDEQWRGDWYPLTLIKDSYFTDYIKELIDDCYELPKELTSGNWPYRHIKIDYEAAAKEATVDYTPIEINGATYWTR